MTMKPIHNQALLSALKSANSILMCTHILPDGDAIGSLLACGRIMTGLGKQVTLVSHDGVPEKYGFLPGASQIIRPEALGEERFDLALSLDISEESRMGDCVKAYRAAGVRGQLDHHATNPDYAELNEVDGDASSTGCMVWRLMRALDVTPDQKTAACIYTAISTDTGNFSFSNTDEETFACAAAMARTGFDLNRVSRAVHLVRAVPHVRLLGRALSTLTFFADGACACMKLTRQDYADYGALPEHSDGIVNYALNLPGVCMAYLADTGTPGFTKVSFRAVAPYHVSDVAALLDGGGHVLAAGCRTEMASDRAEQIIRQAMTQQIGERQ